jgi:hypothetical protein
VAPAELERVSGRVRSGPLGAAAAAAAAAPAGAATAAAAERRARVCATASSAALAAAAAVTAAARPRAGVRGVTAGLTPVPAAAPASGDMTTVRRGPAAAAATVEPGMEARRRLRAADVAGTAAAAGAGAGAGVPAAAAAAGAATAPLPAPARGYANSSCMYC